MAKIVGALVGDKRFYEFADQPPEFLHGALGTFAQRGFEFRECHLDWVEVWRIGGQIADCCANSRDCFAHPVDFVGPQIVHEYDVAFCQRRNEHLLDIGHECGSIHRTVDDIGCAVRPLTRSAAMNVRVFQWPCGTLATSRLPRGERPEWRTILVVTDVSSIKTSRFARKDDCSAFSSARAAATSGRSCSAACSVFFERDAVPLVKPPDRGSADL